MDVVLTSDSDGETAILLYILLSLSLKLHDLIFFDFLFTTVCFSAELGHKYCVIKV